MSVKIACPYCSHELSLKTIKAGRFKLTCARCEKQFSLVIDEGPPPKLTTRKIADEAPAPKAAPNPPAPRKPIAQPTTAVAQPTKPAAQPTKPGVQAAKLTAAADVTKAMSQNGEKSGNAASLDQTVLNDAAPAPDPGATIIGGAAAAPAEFSVDAPASKSKARSRREPGSTPTARLNAQSTTLGMPTDEKPQPAGDLPERLGGYRVLSELGRGGMGSVYLARQLTLNRKVALKTIQAAWSADPRAIARFIREAYAAAQLTHHNVVQIYDLGEDNGVNFFSMELVSGGSLDELLRKHGKVEPRTAASYILQAARGLKFAHDHGMVHRDVKPANLMLTTDSLVKVADLGLVKTPGLREDELTAEEDSKILLKSARTQVTGAGATLGTPAYMSPEQADDATTVDHRADIYSLGCTFYALLVGRSPFSTSKNVIEVISKHKTEKIERPDKVIRDVPPELGRIVERMTQRQPGDRYQDLGETIADITKFLSESTAAAKIPNRDHASQIEAAASAFHQVPAVRQRTFLPLAFYAATGLLSVLLLSLSFRVAIATIFVAVLTTILVGAVSAVREGSSPIGSRLRAFVFSSSPGDWMMWAFGGLMGIVVLYAVGMIGWCIGALIISAGIAGTYHVVVAEAMKRQRVSSETSAEDLLKVLRLGGMEESSIQRFIAEFGGRHWEELFERLFGYEAMRGARKTLSAEGKLNGRSRFQPWRDSLIDRLETRIEETRQAREQKMLAGVEQANLKARGVSDAEARMQSQAMAQSMVGVAAINRRDHQPLAMQTAASAAARRERMRAMLQQARSGKPKSFAAVASRTTEALLKQLFGGKLRFVVGALMIAGCTLWAQQNNLLNAENLEKIKATATSLAQTRLNKTDSDKTEAAAATDASSATKIDATEVEAAKADVATQADQNQQISEQMQQTLAATKPLQFPIAGAWFNSFAPGFIGLLILGSSVIVSGWRYSLFAIPAAVLTLLGPGLGVPSIVIPAAWISAAAALVVLIIGLLYCRRFAV